MRHRPVRIYPDAAHGFLFQYRTEVAADINPFLAREEGRSDREHLSDTGFLDV
jgi:hypothetical protein